MNIIQFTVANGNLITAVEATTDVAGCGLIYFVDINTQTAGTYTPRTEDSHDPVECLKSAINRGAYVPHIECNNIRQMLAYASRLSNLK